ncbi:hypothetical protein ASE66_27955 [Bosea sp. Root483D1]|uniref:hypothetical protein n=1 Tax=Bosea sp. Root483D1 TaxID=1736544 RepID=UPI000708D62A|nr:hypothetical protein [Bosea sp. Root483D1]KRE21688.1 hypothetical protein ASE66_27955 [Bosea sp. Root483D1]
MALPDYGRDQFGMGRQQKLVQAGHISIACQGDVTVHLDRQGHDGVTKEINLAFAETRATPQISQLTQCTWFDGIVRRGSGSLIRHLGSDSVGLPINRPSGYGLTFAQ